MRCFFPRYGLRLRSHDAVLVEVGLCFECNVAKVVWPDEVSGQEWFAFDAQSMPAQDLLGRLRAASGDDTAGRSG